MITPTMIPFLVIYFFLILSILPSLIISADIEPKHHPRCPPFHCGSLEKVGFPFSNITHPECGLYVINCIGQTPTIDLKGGRQSEIKNIFYNGTIAIHDQGLQHQLHSKNCNALKNFTLPVSPLISFAFKNPNLTLVKCHKLDPYTLSSLGDISVEHNTYEGCKDDYVIYYSYPEQLKLSQLPDSHIPYCSVVQLPLIEPPPPSPPPHVKKNDPFSLLSAEFSLEWNVLRACSECYFGGGHCIIDSTQHFQCAKGKNGPRKPNVQRKIIIGVSAAVGASLLTIIFVFFFFRRWCRKHNLDTSSTLISRSLSPDLSLKPDPEKGSTYFHTPIFSYKELEEATNNFDDSKELGDGGFGTVYYGELRDGRVVAVKRLYENNCKRVEQFMNEVTILSLLRHQNLVTLYGCTSRHSRELLLVYEYVPNGTVADHLHGEQAKAGLVTWPIRMSIAIESAGALAYLHASDIIHRDVKTNNILLDNNFHVKVADFGLSRLFPTDVTHVSTAPQGTPGYVDPEYYQCYQLTDKSDVYSFGVVLIELISSMPAVDINRHRHEINLSNMAINKIHNHALHELVDSSLGFESDYCVRRMITLVAELAFRCLQQDRDMRPTMAEVVEVLKGIENEGSKVVKGVEVDNPADDVRLLKNIPPLSPDSVMEKLVSLSSTPNTSS